MFFSPRCFCLVLECLVGGIYHHARFGAGWTSDEGHLALSALAEQNISGKNIHPWQEIPRYGVLTDPESTKQLQPRLGHFDWHSGLMDQIQQKLGLLQHFTWFSYFMISTGAGCCLVTVASFLRWRFVFCPWALETHPRCQEEMEYASKGSHVIPSHVFFLQLGPCDQMAFGFPKIQIARRDYFSQELSVDVPGQTVVVFGYATLPWGFRPVGYPYVL